MGNLFFSTSHDVQQKMVSYRQGNSMHKLIEKAETKLLEAGWTPNRSIDISEYEKWLTQVPQSSSA